MEKQLQLECVKERLNSFIDILDTIEPEEMDVEQIDRLIKMIDDLEKKCKELQDK